MCLEVISNNTVLFMFEALKLPHEKWKGHAKGNNVYTHILVYIFKSFSLPDVLLRSFLTKHVYTNF